MRKRIFKLLCIGVFCFIPAFSVLARTVAEEYEISAEAPTEESELWNQDMDQKIDTTIRVLNAIKEEVKDYNEKNSPRIGVVQTQGTVKQKAGAAGKNVNALIKAWRNLRTAVDPAAEDDIDEEAIKANLKSKLSTAIDVMSQIKEGLNEEE
ncbi:MAG: hypothetical protein KAI70_04590 [Candidatus Omnitrophica bacterium]|nr:hypothetical protein [Candidatus Omnitrophota bacterium]